MRRLLLALALLACGCPYRECLRDDECGDQRYCARYSSFDSECRPRVRRE